MVQQPLLRFRCEYCRLDDSWICHGIGATPPRETRTAQNHRGVVHGAGGGGAGVLANTLLSPLPDVHSLASNLLLSDEKMA
jgi:hypothetical protein